MAKNREPEKTSDDEEEESEPQQTLSTKKPAPSNPATTGGGKRPAEKEPAATKESKKSKKNIFQRLFTDADVIVILQGMLDYQELKKKISPTGTHEYDMDDFFEFIKKKLSADHFTKAQVQDKIKRLRKNYKNQKNLNHNHNRNLTKTTPDREVVYSLFSKIWGDDQGKDMAVVATPKVASETAAKKTPTKKTDNNVGDEEKKSIATRVMMNSYGLIAAERVLKIGAELFKGANNAGGAGAESAETWRKLVVEDIEAELKKLDVMPAQTRLVLDVLKSAKH